MRGIVGGASLRGRPCGERVQLGCSAAKDQPKPTRGLSWLCAGEERERARLVDGAEKRQVQVACRDTTDGASAVRASGTSRVAAGMRVVEAKGGAPWFARSSLESTGCKGAAELLRQYGERSNKMTSTLPRALALFADLDVPPPFGRRRSQLHAPLLCARHMRGQCTTQYRSVETRE
jgi:hypothetical protein